MSDKGPELSEVISAMFGDQDSEVARLLIEIFEIAKNASVKTVSAGLEDKIQGYTAEQWQEIIDGGYLCEVADDEGEWYEGMIKVVGLNEGGGVHGKQGHYELCRPAQIKGVMRPIFVEPEDRNSRFVFFSKPGHLKGSSNDFSCPSWDEVVMSIPHGSDITKYIEV